jgi:NADPH:quinone reductase-like Zn-dependent oxidoreductase
MQAIVQSGFGDPHEVLALTEIDRPEPSAGDVIVQVQAVGIAKGTWLMTKGLPYIARPMYGFRTPKQHIAGLQFAGTIAAVGSAVTTVSVGDGVFGLHGGTLAECIAVPSAMVVPVPLNISVEQASVTPVSGITALQAVRDAAQVRAGQRVLVLGASGGVGSFVVQIAKAFGAHVTAVASGRNSALLTVIGADQTIDYTAADPLAGSPAYDVIIDIAGNRPVSGMRAALTASGTLVIVGGTGGKTTMGFGRTIGGIIVGKFVRHRIVGLISDPSPWDLAALTALIANGQVGPVVQQPLYPLARAAEAIDAVWTGRGAGTPVVTLGGTAQL